MKTIHRYQLPIMDAPVVAMPTGAIVLPLPSSSRNFDRIEVWAEVDDEAPMESRGFRVVGTGNPMPAGCAQFVGTVITDGGMCVWHLFEAVR